MIETTIVLKTDSTDAQEGIEDLVDAVDDAEEEIEEDANAIVKAFGEIADEIDEAAKSGNKFAKGAQTLGKGLKGLGMAAGIGGASILALGAIGEGTLTLLTDSMAAWFERTELGAEELVKVQYYSNQLSFSMFELLSGTSEITTATERATSFYRPLAQIMQVMKDRVMESNGAFGFMTDVLGAVALIVVDSIQLFSQLYGVLERAWLGAKLVIRVFKLMGAALILLQGFIVGAGQTLIASLLEPFALFSEKIAGIAARLGMDGVAGALRSVGEGTERMAANLRESALGGEAVAAATATMSEGFGDLQAEGATLLRTQITRAEGLLRVEEDVQDAIAGQYESTQDLTHTLEEAVEEGEELEEAMAGSASSTAEIVENLRDISDYSDEVANAFYRMNGDARELWEYVDRFNRGVKFDFTILEQSRMDIESMRIQQERYNEFYEEQAALREEAIAAELEGQQKLTDTIIEQENARVEARKSAFLSYQGIMDQSLALAQSALLSGENVQKAVFEMVGGEVQARGKGAMLDGALMMFSPNPLDVARAPGRMATGLAAFAGGALIASGDFGGVFSSSTSASIGAAGPTSAASVPTQNIEINNHFGLAQPKRSTAKAVADAFKDAQGFGYV